MFIKQVTKRGRHSYKALKICPNYAQKVPKTPKNGHKKQGY